jgi:ABC-2 type transport system ATP-binding protein
MFGGNRMENILEINNLTKKFKNFKLDNINFSLEKGAVMGFIGQNGAGKTTTIKMIMNGNSKTSGTIKVMGMDNLKNEIEVKANIGYVPDEDYFMSNSNLRRHAKVMKLFFEDWDEALFKSYISKWNISLEQRLHQFSKGTKTKAMLALALAHKPKLLILDEPTAGLDPVARIEVLDLLREFVADGERSVLFSTHITSDLDKIADYITLIHKGKILETLSVDKLEEKYIMLTGSIEELKNLENQFVGIRKGDVAFEGLITRDRAQKYFKGLKGNKPNIENLLTFTIWGNGHEKNMENI